MYHGLKFNSAGQCIEIPGQSNIPDSACVRIYPVVVRHSWVWVWMGDPAMADPALIPPAVGSDDPDWKLRSGFMDYKANYQLISDNLCDFSHLAYVHEKTFGAGDDTFAKTRPRLTRLDRGIRVERWNVGVPTQEYATKRTLQDVWLGYDYLAPGVLLMRNEVHPSGAAAQFGNGTPGGEPLHANFTSQAVTPMSAGTTRYYFSWGPRASEASITPELVDNMFALAQRAFEEDRVMIEAQQRNLDAGPGSAPLFIGHDRGPAMMRGVIERLIQMEQPQALRAASA
jgi:vanillate O-demethylase monooxygenase subunit